MISINHARNIRRERESRKRADRRDRQKSGLTLKKLLKAKSLLDSAEIPIRERWVVPRTFKTTFAKQWRQIMAKQSKIKLPKVIKYKPNKRIQENLASKLESGLYGRTYEEVIDRIVCKYITG